MKDATLYLIHILERVRRIEEYTREGKEAFLRSQALQDAVIRNFEVIGEAAKRIPEAVRRQHPQVRGGGSPGFETY